ncbi:MAG TPA: phosphatidate cytidylyltransferase [Caulobacter sp.]|nr:phosphatidate cytidylyltransferase [Caulobacter sp.]
MTSSPPARRFDWNNLFVRVASASVLIPAVIVALWFGGWAWLLLVSVGVALLANEWGVMSAPVAPARIATAVTVGVLAAVFAMYFHQPTLAWGLVVVGAALAALVARGTAERPADAAYGVIYIAPCAIALLWLRGEEHGRSWATMLFAVTWSADICAFLVGSALKGPKLWPRFSPNKTWSGFFGGLVGAMIAAVLVATFSDATLVWYAAGLVGLAGGLATMAGDLWESALKRRFGVKDSGDLIPGHGGLLDRVDGLMFASVVIAGARLIDHWGWPA